MKKILSRFCAATLFAFPVVLFAQAAQSGGAPASAPAPGR